MYVCMHVHVCVVCVCVFLGVCVCACLSVRAGREFCADDNFHQNLILVYHIEMVGVWLCRIGLGTTSRHQNFPDTLV